ncbi:MAG: hypothetical protein UY03_C0029G0005 [Parcubacteria group bacterium GW2011_GWA2_47_64]|nr:MAG: hypothetical protein UY03_C0029G0005 [Parcubacteria group bacterium GW2011_GWA2_47_64]
MRTAKTKTRNIAILFFSLILTLAVFSQLKSSANADKPQTTSDVVWVDPSDYFYSKTSNDNLSAYLGKKGSNVPTVRYQKDKYFLEFSMNQVSSTTAVSLETNSKEPNTPTLFYRNIAENIDAAYKITNLPFQAKEEIVLRKNPTLTTKRHRMSFGGGELTFLFNSNTNTVPVKQPDGSIYFYDNQNNYLFQIDKPFMVDGEGTVSNDVGIEIVPVKSPSSPSSSSSYKVKNNFQFPTRLPDGQVSNFQSIFKQITSSFSSLKINHQTTSDVVWGQHTITLSASSDWLNDPSRVYPIIIDPTITHNADANFSGEKNRIADADSTSSTQLESSYPEATLDPYTVLLLHFNEANGTTSGIKDYASTTRVITANGNASTTSYVTQLGLGNSAAFDGTGDYLTMPDSDDWNFGSGDFSIDFWVKFNTVSSNQMLYDQRGGGSAGVYVFFSSTTGLNFRVMNSGGTNDDAVQGSTAGWSTGVWYHVATIRQGNNLTAYRDDTVIATATINPTNENLTTLVYIGTNASTPTVQFPNGNFDEYRILKGRALTPEEIKAAASRRPSAVYTSPVLDAAASVSWDTLNWTEGGVRTGDGETLYNSANLVAQWNFNETSGATADNAEGTAALDGTLTNFASTGSQDAAAGTGWTANNKKWGAGALMISGVATADLVSVADPASNVLDPNSADLTIETWIKTSDISAEIFSNNNANGTACTNNGYYLGIDASGYPVFYLDTNGATAGCDASITSQFKINDGFWHKVAVSVTRGTSAIIYVDGKSASSDTSVTSYSAITVTGNVYFGGSAGGLDAIIDSARIYSRALSASEILSNYNAGNIEIQTRTGATSDPNDGSWEAWKPTTGETQLLNMDSDAVNWHSDIMASTTIATSTDTVIKAEGTGSLKVEMGKASTTAGTVALWHFEETGTSTGTYLYDETANNNDATTTGTTVVDGIFGKARKFNSSSDYLTSGTVDTYKNFHGAADTSGFKWTIDFWTKINSFSALQDFIGNTLNADTDAGFRIAIADSRLISLQIGRNGGDAYVVSGEFVSGAYPADNGWHHVAVTYDQSLSSDNAKAYVDGIYLGGFTKTGQVPETTVADEVLRIGQTVTGTRPVNGSMDELRMIYGRALSADEIAETYRMGANHHLTRQVSAADLSSATKLPFYIAGDRPGTYLEAMIGESDFANYELASSTLALSTTTVLYIKGDEIASSTSIKDSSFSGKTITANGNARTAGGGKIGNSVYFDGTGDYLSLADSEDWNFGTGDFAIDFWVKFNNVSTPIFAGYVGGTGEAWYLSQETGNLIMQYAIGSWSTVISTPWSPSTGVWYYVAIERLSGAVSAYVNGARIGSSTFSTNINNGTRTLGIGAGGGGVTSDSYMDEFRIIKGAALTADQIRQAYEYGLRSHPITIDFGATLQTSDLISSATDYNFSLTATTSGLSATTSGLYLGDKIIIKENLGGTEYTAQGTVNAINTTTGAITVPSWDSGSTFPSGNGYSPNATVFKWQREYFDITGAATTTRNAITNLTIRPTNGAGGRTVYLDDFRYNTNYLTASSSSAITSGNNRYLQYRTIFTSTDTYVSPFLSAFNTLYTSLATMFPPLIGISGGGFLSF